MKNITIAIDGYSACGKSTLAKALAQQLNYTYIDSGAMYRAVTYWAVENNCINGTAVDLKCLRNALEHFTISFETVAGQNHTFVNGKDVETIIRSLKISQLVSHVAKIDFVRTKLVELQRQMGQNGGVVMDGRDIGTVVFPNADLKLFITADLEVRTERRLQDFEDPQSMNLEEVKENLLERDRIDTSRDISPLKKADDAVVIDNSELSKEAFIATAVEEAQKVINQ